MWVLREERHWLPKWTLLGAQLGAALGPQNCLLKPEGELAGVGTCIRAQPEFSGTTGCGKLKQI